MPVGKIGKAAWLPVWFIQAAATLDRRMTHPSRVPSLPTQMWAVPAEELDVHISQNDLRRHVSNSLGDGYTIAPDMPISHGYYLYGLTRKHI